MRNLERYLLSFGNKVLKGARSAAKDKGYALGKELGVRVAKTGDGFSVEFIAPGYAEFVDKGVSGNKKTRYYKDYKGAKRKSPYKYGDKAPPSEIFEKWIKKKGIKGRDKKTGRFIKRKSLAFVMAKSMQVKGRDGIGIFQRPLQLQYKRLHKEIAQAITNDMKELITKQ
tara:strand:- start:482 stop:991 length:510 start_codon:yes stop_codon:yes gene_type:complete